MDLRPSLDPALSAFGVSVVVTRPDYDDTPIATTGFWLSPLTDDQPVGTDFTRREPRRVLVVPRAAVPTAPRGTLVTAPELEGGASRTWRVDGFQQVADPDHFRLIVALVE